MERKREQRRQRKIERTREDIINASVRVMARKGPAATTMEDIAVEAGFATGTLYNYFSSKTELIKAGHEHIFMMLMAAFDFPVPTGTAFWSRLGFILERAVELVEENREMILVYNRSLWESSLNFQVGNAMIENHFVFQRALESLLETGVAEGEIPADKSKRYAAYLHGLVETTFQTWAFSDGQGSLRDDLTEVLVFFKRGAGR